MASVASSQSQVVTIDFDDVQLLPNTANQPVDLFVTVSGPSFNATGILTETESTASNGPLISNVDLFTAGSLFAGNNNGAAGGAVTPRIFERSTLTSSGTVTVPVGTSKYGTVYFDTTGIFSGIFNYAPNTLNGPTVFHTSGGDLTPGTLAGGNLTIVPEPSTYALISGLGCLGLGVLVRRARAK